MPVRALAFISSLDFLLALLLFFHCMGIFAKTAETPYKHCKNKIMKKIIISSVAALSLCFSYNMWNNLDMSEDQCKQKINDGFIYGGTPKATEKMKEFDAQQRVELVKKMGAYIKNYVSTPEFKNYYMKLRNDNKPVMLKTEAKTGDQLLKEQAVELEKGIANTQKMIDEAKDDKIKKQLQDALATQKQKYEEFKEEPVMDAAQLDEYNSVQKKEQETQYEEDLARWNKDYPADTKQLVKIRLQQFLDETADVDFKASLDEKGNKKVFSNPAYESKSVIWKKAYRAGPEATQAARSFAQNWMSQLN